MPLAALYLRSSKDRADVSPEAQRADLQRLAAAKSLTVVAEYVDVVQSGKTEDRPGFQELLLALRDPKRSWSFLLMLDTSRLARNIYIAQGFEYECKRRGVTILYAKLPDMDPATEVIIKAVFQGFDQWHSMMSREKGRAGMASNVRRGFRAGGRAPLGFKLEHVATGAVRDGKAVTKSRLVPDEHVDTVRSYLQLRAQGMPRVTAVAKSGLSALGLVDLEWNALTYAGATVWNMRRAEGDAGRKRRPRSEWVIQHDTHEAVITLDQAELILQRLEAGQQRETRNRADSALLVGLLRTPAGEPWWADGKRSYRVRSGEQRRHITREHVDQAVLRQIAADMDSADFIKAVAIETRQATPAERLRLKPLRKQLQDLDARIRRMIDTAAEMDGSRAPALRRIQELEDERGRVAMQLATAETQWAEVQARRELSEEDVREVLAGIPRLPADDRQALRDHLLCLLERVELDPETGACSLRYRIQGTGRSAGLETPLNRRNLASPWGCEPKPVFLTGTSRTAVRPFKRRRTVEGSRARGFRARSGVGKL